MLQLSTLLASWHADLVHWDHTLLNSNALRRESLQAVHGGLAAPGFFGRGRVPEFLYGYEVCARAPLGPGRVSYPPGPILKSVLLWLCFGQQKSACMVRPAKFAGPF